MRKGPKEISSESFWRSNISLLSHFPLLPLNFHPTNQAPHFLPRHRPPPPHSLTPHRDHPVCGRDTPKVVAKCTGVRIPPKHPAIICFAHCSHTHRCSDWGPNCADCTTAGGCNKLKIDPPLGNLCRGWGLYCLQTSGGACQSCACVTMSGNTTLPAISTTMPTITCTNGTGNIRCVPLSFLLSSVA